MKASRRGITFSAIPGLLMLGLFYSLAIHMRLSLGAWPSSIGEHGFSRALLAHARITVSYFAILLLVSLFALPVATLICWIVPKWQRVAPYLLLAVLMFFLCWGLMQFAPGPFLNWWRD